MTTYAIRPVTDENWDDFSNFFGARGAPHYCWCSLHRFPDEHNLSSEKKKGKLQQLVLTDTPIGVIAYEDDLPVAWCSIAPRETYQKLAHSRKMPRVTPAETPTWTILCFFVSRTHRAQGITHELLRGAIAYARAEGALVIEGYPFDSAGISSTHRGHSSLFEAAGFRQDGLRWFLDLDPA